MRAVSDNRPLEPVETSRFSPKSIVSTLDPPVGSPSTTKAVHFEPVYIRSTVAIARSSKSRKVIESRGKCITVIEALALPSP